MAYRSRLPREHTLDLRALYRTMADSTLEQRIAYTAKMVEQLGSGLSYHKAVLKIAKAELERRRRGAS